MQIGHTSNVFPRCTCSSTRSTQPLWISTKRWRCSPTSQWLMSRSSTLTTGEVFIYFRFRSLTAFGMQSCKHHRGHGDCQQGFGSVQRGGGKVPQVGRNNCFQFVVCQPMILSHHKLATNDLFSMSGVWKPMPSMLRCWMTSRYSFIYDLCQEKIIQAELYESVFRSSTERMLCINRGWRWTLGMQIFWWGISNINVLKNALCHW